LLLVGDGVTRVQRADADARFQSGGEILARRQLPNFGECCLEVDNAKFYLEQTLAINERPVSCFAPAIFFQVCEVVGGFFDKDLLLGWVYAPKIDPGFHGF
jgi:hypothetical protein